MTAFTVEPEDDDLGISTPFKELVEPTQPTPKAIRAWALEKGLPVGKRGRIPTDVVLAYDLARNT